MTPPNISEPPVAHAIYDGRSPEPAALPVEQRPALPRAKAMLLPAALMALFLFSQLFDYHALHLSTFTPDKVLFLILGGLFAQGVLTGRLRSMPWSGTEICMALFAIL